MADTMAAPLVSIIIPTYDRAHTVGRAVASAFAQEGVTVEVIVVDDGSSDTTSAVLQDLITRHGPALRAHRQANAGASAARNAGLDLARGSFVQFLDSDDTLEPEKLRLQLSAYAADPAPTLVLCHGWLEEGGEETQIGDDLGHDPQRYIEEMCGRAVHVVQTSAPLWRRAYLVEERRWNRQISLGDDLDFHIRCLAAADRIGFVRAPLFKVHDHAGDRLSDFSTNRERLASLLQTRIDIHDTLTSQGRWNKACAANTATALRSIYTVYLQRMASSEVAHFDRAAQRICGAGWRGPGHSLMAAVRRAGGQAAARAFAALALHLRRQMRRFTLTWMAHGVRRLGDRTARMSLRGEFETWRSLRAKSLNYPQGRSALYVELNEFHTELVPGYVALLADAGYRTVVLHRHSVDVADALSRMPEDLNSSLVPLSLRGLRRFLRSDAMRRYEVVMIGTGTLAEKNGYWGGVFDFLGIIPDGRRGHLVVEHALKTLFERKDRRRSESLFALRDMQFGKTHLPMLAPVEFGRINPAPLSEPVVFTLVGRLSQDMRDVVGLFAAVRAVLKTDGPAFEVHLIGGATLSEVPDDIRHAFRALGRMPFAQMYDALDRTHFLLALLDSRTAPHRGYLHHNTTGTRQLSLGFRTPMVMDRAFAEAYGFDPATAMIHAPGRLQEGIEAALRLDPAAYAAMQESLEQMQSDIKATSLANFYKYLRLLEESA